MPCAMGAGDWWRRRNNSYLGGCRRALADDEQDKEAGLGRGGQPGQRKVVRGQQRSAREVRRCGSRETGREGWW